MNIVESIKTFFADEARKIAEAQASQEAFNAKMEAQVEKHGIVAVSRAKRPLEL